MSFIGISVSADGQEIKEAQEFIAEFERLSHNYDGKLISMYADNAKIIRNLEHKNGKVEKIIIPTDKYKKFLKFVGFFAKIQGYKNYYKNLDYKAEGENVRITGIRANTNKYTAPVSILVGKNEKGEWRILEEITSTQSAFLIKEIFLRF
ncbi:MAG: hypothetical protein A2Y25_00950 [Candidatus Melainabacteria bacterium GWF2_37_15]|nr:MAG: hypothetical protein A2Y25_00950 [Candidatus Melainabacteria bacterium GWF2_37_15]